MPDPITLDLLLTVIASASLVALWVCATLLLPWTQRDLDEAEELARSVASWWHTPAVPVRRRVIR